MLLKQYKAALAAGILAVLAAGAPRAMAVDTLIGGFNGDLSSPFGVDWRTKVTGWSSELVPALSEGTGALRIYHNPEFQGGFDLPGGQALAEAIANNDFLELDIIAPFGMNWRQFFPVLNVNPSWNQGPQVDLTFPTEEQPFQHLSFDLTNVNGVNWKTVAQDWLDNRVPPGDPEWFELVFVFQGADNVFTADFDFDLDVDGADFLIWQQNHGHLEAGPDQGDANLDFAVNDLDLQLWVEQFSRRQVDPWVTLDNVKLVANTPVAAIPEPSTLATALGGALLLAVARGRRQCS